MAIPDIGEDRYFDEDFIELPPGEPRRGDGKAEEGDFGMIANSERVRGADPDEIMRQLEAEAMGGSDMDELQGAGFHEPRMEEMGMGEDVQEQAARIRKRKMELLRKLNDMAARGIDVPSDLTLKTHVDDLEYHVEALERKVGLKASLRFQKRLLVAAVSGLEFMNRQYKDYTNLELDGWSNQVYAQLNDYDGVMERLYDKYRNRVQAPPEVELVLMRESGGRGRADGPGGRAVACA